MLKDAISNEDKEAFRKIYEEVKQTSTHLSQLPRFEDLLGHALTLAERYGKDHPLYSALEQTMREQLIPSRNIPQKSKDRSFALNELKLYFLGDLMGWF
ncbi:MAG: hypothetical protein ACJ749_07690 [Flavisolibacter sp.]